MKLAYQGQVLEFSEITNIEDIKQKFGIESTKNLFKIVPEGDLLALKEENLKKVIADLDQLEAISDFILG